MTPKLGRLPRATLHESNPVSSTPPKVRPHTGHTEASTDATLLDPTWLVVAVVAAVK